MIQTTCTCARVAPTARRMPISFVRSTTLVTSVLVMPMPATNSATRANRFSPSAMSVTSRLALWNHFSPENVP